METVMTLPIYLVLLGGGAWISELTTGKNALATAQYAHVSLFGISNMNDKSSREILAITATNVSNSTFISSTSSQDKGWWREITVNDSLKMTPASLFKSMFSAMGGSPDETKATLTNLTMTDTPQVRYVRSFNGDWRGSEYGNILCNGLVNDIYNQPGPGESASDTDRFSLSIIPVSYYRSHANEYHQYLY